MPEDDFKFVPDPEMPGMNQENQGERKQIEEISYPEEGPSFELDQEKIQEKQPGQGEQAGSDEGEPGAGGIVAIGNYNQKRNLRIKKIENILEDGLSDIYLKLPEDRKEQFKRAGEETCRKINELFETSRAKLGKIVDLIRAWLILIPGVNKYFVEQEAKIKADKLVQLNEEDSNFK